MYWVPPPASEEKSDFVFRVSWSKRTKTSLSGMSEAWNYFPKRRDKYCLGYDMKKDKC